MKYIKASNINEAYVEGWWALKTHGVERASRNGPVMVMPYPVLTEYQRPWERVLLDKERDCNHVFHLMEALWMFAGRDDVASLLDFNGRYDRYAEEGGYVHGAYGHRWRTLFGKDQIVGVRDILRKDRNSRQAVIGMWAPDHDLGAVVNDKPCNTHIYFDASSGALEMTVCCRSNDMLWGAYGANVVHMSMLQELLALDLGLPIGAYRQFSNNFHVYLDVPGVREKLSYPPAKNDGWYPGVVPMLERGETMEQFLKDCVAFFDKGPTSTHFFSKVAEPLRWAWFLRKSKQPWNLEQVVDCDWKTGYLNWLENR